MFVASKVADGERPSAKAKATSCRAKKYSIVPGEQPACFGGDCAGTKLFVAGFAVGAEPKGMNKEFRVKAEAKGMYGEISFDAGVKMKLFVGRSGDIGGLAPEVAENILELDPVHWRSSK